MRSTRATAAVSRLNSRAEGQRYTLVLTGSGLFKLRQRIGQDESDVSGELALDDFVRFVDALGPQQAPRITKNDAAFAKQLVKKPQSS
jgi:hypothetical protein